MCACMLLFLVSFGQIMFMRFILNLNTWLLMIFISMEPSVVWIYTVFLCSASGQLGSFQFGEVQSAAVNILIHL